ncbi:hypothetical protein RvY_18908 [Ramazzottius varieornatus]|uniref:Uncharacterized protein n=1 Tax=Ramazzottius varieornatus TaxID=947166 RepID=A0A1D1WBA9_RAMVA|nr:hypothetical protein RvY_18908 [Ramazzottius varieornatus]
MPSIITLAEAPQRGNQSSKTDSGNQDHVDMSMIQDYTKEGKERSRGGIFLAKSAEVEKKSVFPA